MKQVLVLALLAWAGLALGAASDVFSIGIGKADITGPAAEVGMMGYAMLYQTTKGIHLRQRARAFVFEDDAGTRTVYVSIDACMVMQGVKLSVVEKLQSKYGSMYTDDNVMISGTHTHSGPGGFSWYALYDMTTFGFAKENFEAVVNGIVNAIERAHDSVEPGCTLTYTRGTLHGASANRSPYSYLQNPEEERNQYDGNVDSEHTVIRIDDANGKPRGLIDIFAVHGTSMNNKNRLISADNKGYASLLFETRMNGRGNSTNGGFEGNANGKFVAAFGQSNLGDISPNTNGAHCPNGDPCDFIHSTCNGKTEQCIATGPGGSDDFESCRIIGDMQYKAAVELFEQTEGVSKVDGNIKLGHFYVDMQTVTVSPDFTSTKKEGKTCEGAMGDSFAAGTTDGPGEFDFVQGSNSTKDNPFFNAIAHLLGEPTEEQKQCQYPKPILIDVGRAIDGPWVPNVLPIQIHKIGQIVFVAVPGEFTTMSGRRLRATVRKAFKDAGNTEDLVVLIAGLSNAYSGYITTYEEYQVQRYEGGSTVWGPHTLAAYQQQYYNLAVAIEKGTPVPEGPQPKHPSHLLSFIPPVIADEVPIGKHFGDVKDDVKAQYSKGDTVSVTFHGANPRNDLLQESTYLEVQLQTPTGEWVLYADDGDWSTKFKWERHLVAQSYITVEWATDSQVEAGRYRILHRGFYKHIFGGVKPYSGLSSEFTVE
uniref:Neutral ceramidase n=1 Tax=Palpitomonas bilix TaxID=652834 RepID=A0A7S3GC45_9EUKA|mmetsp:Transcript_4292/g.8599  ORF Transcript_4292/g.8599 Transcript_4292/m.8599 type:complete len:705 (+) Transcript_4292:78-2192(+)